MRERLETPNMKAVPVGVFETIFLALVDEVEMKGKALVISRHGSPVAKLVPITSEKDEVFGFFSGRHDRGRCGLADSLEQR
jgi:antitoxin (DNA-binding transcriptional repressor) of toxin-antitoxin stability system